MNEIPIKSFPNQNFFIVLDQNICKININTWGELLYFSLEVQTTVIATNTICLNLVPLVRQPYLGFNANFLFVDTQGKLDPTYKGLGTRYRLIYLNETESAELL